MFCWRYRSAVGIIKILLKRLNLLIILNIFLAGNGSLEYIESLKKLEGWSKVRYLGRIPHEIVKEIYSESIVGMTLLSNDTQVGDEGTLGNTKIFEYMESGLPVICSNNKLWSEIVKKHECGIAINPIYIYEIIEAILYFKNDQKATIKIVNNIHNALENVFNWKTQEKVLIGVYFGLYNKELI